ncbi:hypothetical protein [Intestinibacter sp.]
MFNKTIYKQTFKSNIKIWLIITAVLCAFNVILIAVFDPSTISSVSDMVKDTPLANMLEDTSFLGMLSQTFYTIQAIILPLIYIIATANMLIVSQVDRGSMAYILSTPVKRSKVVGTQITYFVTALFTMVSIATVVGIFAIQGFHGGIWDKGYTKDVEAAAEVLNVDKQKVADGLNLILDDKDALKEGAKARHIDEDAYTAYLNLKITDNAYQAASDVLDVDVDKVEDDPSIIKENDKALEKAAKVMGMDKDSYSVYLDQLVAQKKASSDQAKQMQDKVLTGISAAAEVLDMEESDLASDMKLIKDSDKALDAAVEESGIPEEMFMNVINNQIASSKIAEDKGVDFSLQNYLMLNLGLFLLMFATSGVSFMFSCIFNLSKNYMALGGGIPIAFFLINMMGTVSDSLEKMKYITLNSLFDTSAVLNGGNYAVKFVAMGVIGVVLYAVGARVFKRKDLPL